VQNLRKDSGFEVTDRIRIAFTGSERLVGAVTALAPYIKNETLAIDIHPDAGVAGEEIDVNGESCRLRIERVVAQS